MRRSRGGQDDGEATLDITPTIDVVFLLLIFFIATIKLPDPEANIRAYLPKKDDVQATGAVQAKPDETKNETIIRITLRGARELFLNGASIKGGFREMDSKLGALRRFAAPGVDTKVILDAGGEVPYRFVVNALDICAKHDYKNVSFAMPKTGS